MRTRLSNATYGIFGCGAYPIEGTAIARLTYAVASFVLRSALRFACDLSLPLRIIVIAASLIEQPSAGVEVLS
jgi:hypothetical protein